MPVKDLVIEGPFQRVYSEVRAAVGHRLSFHLIRELYADFREGRIDAGHFHCGDYMRLRGLGGRVIQ